MYLRAAPKISDTICLCPPLLVSSSPSSAPHSALPRLSPRMSRSAQSMSTLMASSSCMRLVSLTSFRLASSPYLFLTSHFYPPSLFKPLTLPHPHPSVRRLLRSGRGPRVRQEASQPPRHQVRGRPAVLREPALVLRGSVCAASQCRAEAKACVALNGDRMCGQDSDSVCESGEAVRRQVCVVGWVSCRGYGPREHVDCCFCDHIDARKTRERRRRESQKESERARDVPSGPAARSVGV